MKFPTFTGSRWFAGVSLALILTGCALVVAGCSATLDKNGPGLAVGSAANDVRAAGEMLAARGAESGNPITSTLGYILSTIGTIGAAVYGAKKVNDKSEWTPEERADIARIGKEPVPPAAPQA